MQKMKYTVRPMRDEDIIQVVEIDHEAFCNEWPRPTYASFKRELRNRIAHYLVVCEPHESAPQKAKVEPDSRGLRKLFPWFKKSFDHDRFFDKQIHSTSSAPRILGFAGFWIMANEAHLTTIAVRETHRRQGLAEGLLISVIDLATQLKARIVTLEVRISNKIAQSLYEKHGFHLVKVQSGYYVNDGEDGLFRSTDDITSTSFQSKFEELKRTYIKNNRERIHLL